MRLSILCIIAALSTFSVPSQASFLDLFCIDDPNSPEACKPATPKGGENVTQKLNEQKTRVLSEAGKIKKAQKTNQCVVVKGIAPSKGADKAFARKMAIRDGLKQASLKNNVIVKTDQSVESYQLKRDSTRFTSSSKIKSFSVIKEGFEDAEDLYGQTKKGPLNYEVTLNVCLTEQRGVCTNLPGNQYQPRLVIAPVVFPHSYQARDVSDLLSGYQLELERRALNQGYKNQGLLKQPVELQPNIQVAPNLDPELMASIRDKTGAQYLLLTIIRSMSSHVSNGVESDVRRFYNLEVKPESRYLETDWYVVDLLRKEVVHRARGGFKVEGEVTVGRDKPFGSNGFFATNTGKAFDKLLAKQVQDTLDYLHCKSFESEIIDVRGNEYVIYLNANSGVKVGDDLAVYHKVGRPIRFGGAVLGTDQIPGAFLKIKRIMPRFAIAELSAKKGLVQVGDVVKAW